MEEVVRRSPPSRTEEDSVRRGLRVSGRLADVPAMTWALDLPLVWVTWGVPRGVLYRHEEDEGEGDLGGLADAA